MKNALIIFVRNPELGKVKTRLANTLGDEKALDIYKELLQHTFEIASAVDASKYVFYFDKIEDEDIWNAD
ncbi:MAG: glycosyltransferase, partial [Bacteroidota bacterium]|nr:glycosyltransferase [Bacteroidota bacterium]